MEVVKSERIPSPYQTAIYDWIRNGSGHAVIEAVAGSGKTTTILDSLRLTNGKVLFTAFNQAIAAELQKRAPGHVKVSTLHSLGLRSIRKAEPFFDVDSAGEKLNGVVQRQFPDVHSSEEMKKVQEIRTLAKRVMSLAKATLVEAKNPVAVGDMVERFGIESENLDDEDIERIVEALPDLLSSCKADRERVDFDDMVWFPIALDLKVEKFDWIFVDEAQDMNRCQLELIMKAAGPNTRFVCVGDRAQSIYGFRGADVEAIPSTIRRLNATVFPLSITYRCPSSHVEMAKALVPKIEARPDAPKGVVETVPLKQLIEVADSEDLILCRTNAPLVQVAFSLIRAGKKAVIRGKEIGTNLIAVVKQICGKGFATMSVDVMLGRLDAYCEKEIRKLARTKKSTVAFADKVETIVVLSEDVTRVSELIAKTERIFDDRTVGIVCSSVHHAKGLEANRVFVVNPDLMPHPMAVQDWELEQENNIKYVALTRSKNELYFVYLPKKQVLR